jgi:hypothetical protein
MRPKQPSKRERQRAYLKSSAEGLIQALEELKSSQLARQYRLVLDPFLSAALRGDLTPPKKIPLQVEILDGLLSREERLVDAYCKFAVDAQGSREWIEAYSLAEKAGDQASMEYLRVQLKPWYVRVAWQLRKLVAGEERLIRRDG